MCDVTILFFTFRFRNFSEVKMLCEDMLLEILSRLPVRSLKRFMCVSKNFQSIILDARFLRMHLQNSRKRTNIMLSYSNKGKTYVDASPISSLKIQHPSLLLTLSMDLSLRGTSIKFLVHAMAWSV